ncbi:MAG: LysM domain-containing protein [Gammaproteobacteria bacterium]
MSRKFGFIAALMLVFVPVVADEVLIKPDHPGVYTVVKGDTLWDIAGRFLQRPWQWPDIWEVNPQIDNPHLIYPGDRLALTYKDGRPILGLVGYDRNVKLSPSVRVIPHREAIHTIPLDAVAPFLTRPRVVDAGALDQAAYIVGSQDEHLTYGNGHRIYARGLENPQTNKFSVYRAGPPYRDPETGEVLGYEAEHLGDARVEKFGDPATLVVTNSFKEMRKGDRLVPQDELEIPEFIPHAPGAPVSGRIISVMNGVSQITQHQVVVLNRGVQDGLEPGHVLAIFQEGEVIEDVIGSDIAERNARAERERVAQEHPNPVTRMLQTAINDVRAADRALRDFVGTPVEGSGGVKVQLPEERAGELMVFRTFDRVSYGLVMNMQRAIHLNDRVANP